MFTNIIWATDGSENADRALEYASQLARSEGASLHAIHVVEKMVGPRVAGQNAHLDESDIDDKIKRQVARAEHSGVDAQLHMTRGTPQRVATQIAAVAGEAGADLIIVGTRGHSAIAGLFLGSVTQRLLHIAHVPVLAVPPGTLAPTDDSTTQTVSSTG